MQGLGLKAGEDRYNIFTLDFREDSRICYEGELLLRIDETIVRSSDRIRRRRTKVKSMDVAEGSDSSPASLAMRFPES